MAKSSHACLDLEAKLSRLFGFRSEKVRAYFEKSRIRELKQSIIFNIRVRATVAIATPRKDAPSLMGGSLIAEKAPRRSHAQSLGARCGMREGIYIE